MSEIVQIGIRMIALTTYWKEEFQLLTYELIERLKVIAVIVRYFLFSSRRENTTYNQLTLVHKKSFENLRSGSLSTNSKWMLVTEKDINHLHKY